MKRPGPALLLLLPALLAIAVVAWVAARSARLPSGPVDLVWDRAACAFCKMHVGEPPFAAQLQDRAGNVLAFDDPGCLFEYEAEAKPEVHAIYFHHHQEDRWLVAPATAFVEVTPTPMGYGLGAVAAGTPGAIDLAAARARCLARGTTREGGR